MIIKPTLVLTFEFKAATQRVFDVLTQANHLNRWFTQDARIDLQVGGHFSNGDGDRGKFLKVAVPRNLIFEYSHDKLGVETEVDLTFETSGPLDWTRLRMVQKGLDPKIVSSDAYSWMNDRWNYMAAALAAYVARQSRLTFDQWQKQTKLVYGTRL